MPVDLRETRLPGVGVKYGFRTSEGGRLAIVLHNDGMREIYFFRHEYDDEPAAVIRSRKYRVFSASRSRSSIAGTSSSTVAAVPSQLKDVIRVCATMFCPIAAELALNAGDRDRLAIRARRPVRHVHRRDERKPARRRSILGLRSRDEFLRGEKHPQPIIEVKILKRQSMPLDFLDIERQPIPMLPLERRTGVTEVEVGAGQQPGIFEPTQRRVPVAGRPVPQHVPLRWQRSRPARSPC